MKYSLKFLILLFFSGLGLFLSAQSADDSTASNTIFGVKAGGNISTIYFDNDYLESGFRPFAGVYLDHRVFDRLHIHVGALYSLKSSSFENSFTKLNTHYIDIELIPRIRIYNRFMLQFGITYSKLLQGRLVFVGAGSNGTEKREVDLRSSEISLPVGLSFKFQNNINLSVNYNFPVESRGTKNIQIGLTLPFNLGNKNKPRRKVRWQEANKQIKALRNGILLVRLSDAKKQIQALEERGYAEKALEVYNQKSRENRRIIAAFDTIYDFSKVSFFYSSSSAKIAAGNYEEALLNYGQIADTLQVPFDEQPVFIADFGPLKNPDALDNDVNSYSSGISFEALRIMDRNFKQLKRPFPYYTRASHRAIKKHPESTLFALPILPFSTYTYRQTVFRMNVKLWRFWD